jgi:hypothetical protein
MIANLSNRSFVFARCSLSKIGNGLQLLIEFLQKLHQDSAERLRIEFVGRIPGAFDSRLFLNNQNSQLFPPLGNAGWLHFLRVAIRDRQISCSPGRSKLLKINGERGRNRTFNLLIKSQLLCQLSYAPFALESKEGLHGRHPQCNTRETLAARAVRLRTESRHCVSELLVGLTTLVESGRGFQEFTDV